MFRKKIATLSLALAMMMGAPTVAPAAEQMENGVWIDGFRVGSTRTGRVVMFYFAQENEGKISICGNYYLYGGGANRRLLERALNRYRFFYNGSFVTANASFLWRAPTEERIGEQVGCHATTIPFANNSNDLLSGSHPNAR